MASYRIPNTYQTPIASALGNLMTAFSSIPTQEDVALKQAKYDDLTSSAALNRSKVEQANREAQYGQNLAGIFRKAMTPVEQARATPDSVGPMPEVPADERIRAALPDIAGALPPNQVGQLADTFTALMANTAGTTPEAVSRAQQGSKVGYNMTQVGAEAERDRKIALEDRKDVRTQQSAQYAADRAATAQEAIAGRQAHQVIGPDGKAYWYVGTEGLAGKEAPFAQQSGPLATDAVKARGQLDALNSFRQKGVDLLNLARSEPSALGAAGSLRTIVSGAAEQAKALGQSLGFESTPQLVGQVQDFLKQQGVTVADPAVASKIAVYLHQMPYDAAAALAGQQGRSVTDNDVKRFARLLGETPISNLADWEARWQAINKIIDDETARVEPRLNMRPAQPGVLTPGPTGLGANVQRAFPAAAPVNPGGGAPRRRYNPATGQIE